MRKLLRGMRLPSHQWREAMDHAVMLHNLLLSSSLPNNASPHLLWTGKLGNTKMLRVFGCMVVYRPHTARAGRFSQRAQWGLHLGIERHYNAWKIFDVHSKETVAAHDVIFYERHTLQTYLDNLAANRDLTGGFHGNRAFASVADEADWDEQNMDGASEEAGPLPHCSVNIPMDDDNPRESVNAETYSDFADTGYVTPQPVDTNVSERIGPNFLPDPEAGDEAAYPEDANLPRYTQSGLQILGLVTAGPAPSGVSQVDPLPGPALVQVAVDSGATRGAVSGGAEPAGAESEGAETGGAKPRGVAPGGAEPEGVEPGGAEPGGSAGASPRLSPQQLREWFVRRPRLWSGASGAGGAGATGAGGTRVAAGVGVTRGTATTGPGGARTRGTGAAGTGGVGGAGVGVPMESGPGVGGTGAGGAGVVDPGGNVRPRPYFVPLLQQLLDTPPSASLTAPLLCPPPDQSQPPLQPASPLPAPSPYTEESGGLTERREPASCPVSPVRTARHVPRLRPPPLPGTHAMTLPPSSVPLRVPLPAPPESSLPEVADPESDRARTASPTFSRLLATAVTDPSFESTAAYALVAELLDFAAACRLDYATALVAESASASPPSVGGECALGIDVLEDMQEDFECLVAAVPRFASMLLALEGDPDAPDIPTPRSYSEAITGPYSSQWQAAMDVEMASWKSTGTYVDEVPPPGANIVNGMWIFRMKWPPGSPPAFKARYHSCMSAVYLHVYNC
ncbi:unnamed protein product [Closterium sp. NIES-54]